MTKIAEALRDLEEEKVYQLIDEMLNEGVSPIDIINQCNEGIVAVGELFASNQYFLTELMFSAEIMQTVMEKLEPLITAFGVESESVGTVIIGTVKGDVHDIGKNIVINLLRSNGFKIVDLGVDVPAEKFVETVLETGAKVVGLSALLNSTYPEMRNVVEALKGAGLRDQVRVIIGGTVCSEKVREFTGADFYASDAQTGVKICKEILG